MAKKSFESQRFKNLRQRWEAGEVEVSTWFERDRMFVGIQEVASGDYLAEWWDENVAELFDDGFFVNDAPLGVARHLGGRFERSVIDYAERMGVRAYPPRKKRGIGDPPEIPLPEMWTVEDVVRAVRDGHTFLLPFIPRPGPNAYWIAGHQFNAFGLTVGPEHTPELSILPDGWLQAVTWFSAEMVPERAWLSRPRGPGRAVDARVEIDPDTVDWELLNGGRQVGGHFLGDLGGSFDSEMKDVEREALAQGWRVDKTSAGHWRFVPADKTKPIVFTSGTPSDWRSFHNFLAKMRRSGFVRRR